MYDVASDLVDALRATPDVLDGVLRGCTQEQAQSARGGDEDWSVVEVMCHLRDAEERSVQRVEAMRDADDPFLSGYDQEQWARERAYARADLREALAAFGRFRAAHVAALEALDTGGWERTGRHEEQGAITVHSHSLHIVSHDAIHAAQIARQLTAAAS